MHFIEVQIATHRITDTHNMSLAYIQSHNLQEGWDCPPYISHCPDKHHVGQLPRQHYTFFVWGTLFILGKKSGGSTSYCNQLLLALLASKCVHLPPPQIFISA